MSAYDATRIAVANGFIIVAAAEKGDTNLGGNKFKEKYDESERNSELSPWLSGALGETAPQST